MGRGWKLAISMILLIFITKVPQVLSQGKDDILAKVGEEVITKEDVEMRLKNYPPGIREELKNDMEKRKEFLNNLITGRLFVIEGRNRGLPEDPEIQAKLRMIQDDFLIREYIKKYHEKEIQVSEEEAEKYYNAHPDIREKEHFKVSKIILKSEEEAKEVLTLLKKGGNFRKIAMERSADPISKNIGGEMDWFERGKGKKEIESAVMELKKGEVSDIAKIEGDYYIFQLDERVTVPKPPFQRLKDEIMSRLRNQKLMERMDREIKELRKKIPVEIYEDKMRPGEKQ
jgi:peptidyl-prolyl cis-trans isomerase C